MAVYRGEIIWVEEFGTKSRSVAHANLIKILLDGYAKQLLKKDAQKAAATAEEAKAARESIT